MSKRYPKNAAYEVPADDESGRSASASEGTTAKNPPSLVSRATEVW